VPLYPGLQYFSTPFDWSKSGTWQGKEIQEIIGTLAVNCLPIPVWSKVDGKLAAETASEEMVMGAVQALCEFSLLVNLVNHSYVSLNALDDALNWFYKKKGFFRELTMSKSAKAKVNELLAMESHQLWEQYIHTIRAAMEVLVYRAQKVTISKRRQFQVHLKSAWQATTKWSEVDLQRA
jgi:hypothetical protein